MTAAPRNATERRRPKIVVQEAERHVTMPGCKKGNTFPDEGWHDGDDELVNRGLVQKGPDDPASAHYPDVLASLRAEAFGKGTDRLGECSKPSGQSECKTRTGTGGAEARTERKVRRGQKSQFR